MKKMFKNNSYFYLNNIILIMIKH